MKKTVLVAMSGGVDSTYALISLLNEGYDVVGVTFKINNNENTLNSIEDAARIAKLYNIKHLVVDYTEVFNKEVVNYFIETYRSGKTPNPCVICNRKIKFGELDLLRRKLGLDYIATGHYVNVEKLNGNFYIKKAKDIKKDQSYFLNQVSKDILPFCLFPLGNVQNKEYVRKFLADNNIDVAQKKDSQEICFIEDNDFANFLKEYIPEKKGIIKDIDGKTIGNHKGTSFYTIGQRKGLGISCSNPLFIKKIDPIKNEITVCEEEFLYFNTVKIKNVNILAAEFLDKSLTGKIRYRSKEYMIEKITQNQDYYEVKFIENQKSVTPGQYLVVYHNDYLVLGGEIT